mgnify:CR=1 FL=1
MVPTELRPAAPEVDLGLWADDSSRLPRIEPAPVGSTGLQVLNSFTYCI